MDATGNDQGAAESRGFGAGITDLPGPARAEIRGAEGRARAAATRRRADARDAEVRDLLALGPLDGDAPPLRELAAAAIGALAVLEGDPGLPPLPSVDRVVSAAEVAVASDPAFATAPLVALRPHWCEPVASWVGRAVAALERRARVLLVTSRALEPLAERLAAALEASLGPSAITAAPDPQYDLVRRIAGIAGVEVDLLVPDAFATSLVRSMEQARSAADPDDAPASDVLRERLRGAFGAGVVDAGRAALRIRSAEGRSVAYDAGPEAAHRADLALDEGVSPEDAAREVARLAFGPDAIGGYASEAVARVHVGARRLSDFTAALLEALEDDALGLGPPPWTRTQRDGSAAGRAPRRAATITSRLDPAALAARRIGLDEGATLIHDDLTPGAHALVFTNVEPRMRLGSTLRGPAILALLRVRG